MVIAQLDGQYMPESEIRALIASEAAAIPFIKGRPTDATRDQFRSRGITSILPRRNEKSWKVRADRDTLRTLRIIMDRDPDVSKAVENFILLIGKGYKTTAYRRSENLDAKKTEDPRAQALIDQWDREVGREYGGGIESLIPVWVKTLLWHGAVANELELSDNLRQVVDMHPVPPDSVVFKRDPESGALRRGVMVPRSQVSRLTAEGVGIDADGFLELPERQFQYVPYHPHVNEPYGTSPLVPVIAAIFFKVELLEDTRMAIHVNGHGRLDVKIDNNAIYATMPDSLKRIGMEEQAREWVRERIREVSANFQAIEADESFFHDSTVETKDISPKAIPDLKGIMGVIDNQVIAGVKQLPILLGRNEGATTTHATVQWQLFAVQVEAFARIVARIIDWAHGEKLAAEGIAAYTETEFEQIRATDRVQDEQARTALIDNWIKMIAQGWADHEEASMDVLEHPPVGEPAPPPVPTTAPNDPGDGSGGGGGDTEGGTNAEGTEQQPGADGDGERDAARHGGNPGQRMAEHGGGRVPRPGTLRHDQQHDESAVDATGRREPAGEDDQGDRNPRNPGHGVTTDTRGADRIGPPPNEGGPDADDLAGLAYTKEYESIVIEPGTGPHDEDGDRRPKNPPRKKAIPLALETRAAETVETLDDLSESFRATVVGKFEELRDEYDAAKAAADLDGGAWFETEPGRAWMAGFRGILTEHYKSVWNVRGNAVLDELAIEGVFDLANPEAIAALEEFGLTRVTDMTDTTIEALSIVIGDGIEAGDHPNVIAKAIRDRLGDMTKARSETIARTETAFAYSYAALESYRRNGVERKMWLTAEDNRVDPPCPSHEDEGSIPIDQAFGGTDQHPPAHPRCRCALLADPESRPGDAPTWKGE